MLVVLAVSMLAGACATTPPGFEATVRKSLQRRDYAGGLAEIAEFNKTQELQGVYAKLAWLDTIQKFMKAEERLAHRGPDDTAESLAADFLYAGGSADTWMTAYEGVGLASDDPIRKEYDDISRISRQRAIEVFVKEPWPDAHRLPGEGCPPKRVMYAAETLGSDGCVALGDGLLGLSTGGEPLLDTFLTVKVQLAHCVELAQDAHDEAGAARLRAVSVRLAAAMNEPRFADAWAALAKKHAAAEVEAAAEKVRDEAKRRAWSENYDRERAREDREHEAQREADYKARKAAEEQAAVDRVAEAAAEDRDQAEKFTARQKCQDLNPKREYAKSTPECRRLLALDAHDDDAPAASRGPSYHTCPSCHGTGVLTTTINSGRAKYSCSSDGHGGQSCTETGREDIVNQMKCPQCGGSGQVPD